MRTFLVAVFVFFVLVAQGSTGAAQSVAPQAAGDPVNGGEVYVRPNTSCSNCHGIDAVGGWGPDLAGRNITIEQATKAIREPMWRMPAFVPSQLSEKDIRDMVAYWNSLPEAPAIGEWRATIPADAPAAQQLAVNIVGCGQCHGATLTTPRHGAAEVGGDFEWFKRMVYDHATAMPEKWDLRDASEEGPQRPRRRVRMGNYTPKRLPEAELREIWLFVDLSTRICAEDPAAYAGPALGGACSAAGSSARSHVHRTIRCHLLLMCKQQGRTGGIAAELYVDSGVGGVPGRDDRE